MTKVRLDLAFETTRCNTGNDELSKTNEQILRNVSASNHALMEIVLIATEDIFGLTKDWQTAKSRLLNIPFDLGSVEILTERKDIIIKEDIKNEKRCSSWSAVTNAMFGHAEKWCCF